MKSRSISISSFLTAALWRVIQRVLQIIWQDLPAALVTCSQKIDDIVVQFALFDEFFESLFDFIKSGHSCVQFGLDSASLFFLAESRQPDPAHDERKHQALANKGDDDDAESYE